MDFAVVFDVDGVLYRGGSPIAGAKEALLTLHDASGKLEVPYVYLTNSGGYPETYKAKEISRSLGLDVSPHQVIVAHTPVRALAEEYSTRRVLGVGRGYTRAALEAYGFTNSVTVDEYIATSPILSPLHPDYATRTRETKPGTPCAEDPIELIVVFREPSQWEVAMQVIVDICASSRGVPGDVGTKQIVPIVFANPDVTYPDKFAIPRFTTGAFRDCVKLLYRHATKRDLQYVEYGKPLVASYEFASRVLASLRRCARGEFDLPEPEGMLPLGDALTDSTTVYCIGDNPDSDIAGANSFGWVSVLVRTGVFASGAPNDDRNPARHVCDDVGAAIKLIHDMERSKAGKA